MFVDVCKGLLNMLPIENELNYSEMNKDREKMEQIYKDMTHVPKKWEVKRRERGK